MDIEKVGQFIKELRIENNLSQNQLSEEIHVTRQAVSNWENGKALPDSNILLMLSNLFKVSINEILSGKRLTKEDNLEEIALQLVDENNQKRNKIKKMMISFSTILSVFIIIFLGYYFITNYNSIKVYRVSGKSDVFKTNEGILITTRNKTYLHLGAIEKIKKDDKVKVNKVILYYKDSNKKIIIYEKETTNYLIKEIGNYNEFSISNNKNNLYLEVKYDNNKSDIIKLKIKEDFKNNFLRHNNNKKMKVTKEEPKPKIKKEVFEKVNNNLSYAQEKIENDSVLRRDDNSQNEREILITQDQQKILNENQQIDNNDKVEEVENNTAIVEETNELNNNIEDNINVFDYAKTVDILKEKGTEQYGSYFIEFMNNDTYYNISTQDGTINVFTSDNTIVENWTYIYNMNNFFYQKFENYEEIENFSFFDNTTFENEINIINKFNNILNLLESQ